MRSTSQFCNMKVRFAKGVLLLLIFMLATHAFVSTWFRRAEKDVSDDGTLARDSAMSSSDELSAMIRESQPNPSTTILPTTPTQPVTTPTQPVTSPTKPVTTPTKPATTPTTPVTTTATTTTTTSAMTTPAKSVTTPAKPVTTPAKPVTTPVKLVTSPAKPVTTPAKPVTTPAKPVTAAQPNPAQATSPKAEAAVTSPPTTMMTRPPLKFRYICTVCGGRLGNQIFIHASALGVAWERKMKVVVQRTSPLWDLFNVTASPLVESTGDPVLCQLKLQDVSLGPCCKYNPALLLQVKGDKDVRMIGYYQSYLYFQKGAQAVRQAFRLTSHYRLKAVEVLEKALLQRYKSPSVWRGRTFVGVHVRRGDFALPHMNKFGHMSAPPDYYQRGMKFFDAKFPNVTYVICSDSLDWAKTHVQHEHALYMEGGTEREDFAVLVHMNHTLMSTGSYGWWISWLVNGTTVYYEKQFRNGSALQTEFHPKGEEYIIPGWIAM